MRLSRFTVLILATVLSLLLILPGANAAVPIPQPTITAIPLPTLMPLVVPAAPSDLTGTYSDGKITLQWKDNSNNETGFEISCEFNGNGGSFKVPAGTTSYVLDGTYYAGEVYTYAVRAYNTVGSSNWSSSVDVEIPDILYLPPAISIPNAPSNVKATYANGKITVTWSDNSTNESGFDVLTEMENGGGGNIQVAANTTSWVDDSSHVKGATYSFAVRSYNFFGNSAWSAKVSVTIPDISVIPPTKIVPNAPSDLVATYSNGNISLNWKDNSGNESGFEILPEAASISTSIKVSANTTAWTDTAPRNPGSSVSYSVRAYNLIGSSGWSNKVTVNIPAAQLPTPQPATPTPQPATPPPSSSTPQPALVLDGTQQNWATTEIQDAYNYGLTYPDILNNFQKKITRQEFCILAVKLYEKLSGKQAAIIESPFSDTNNPDILKAYNLEITYGKAPGKFCPDVNVQRQEMAVFIYRTLKAANKLPTVNLTNDFPVTDSSQIASWALEHMKFCYQYKIIGGYNNKINPLGPTTREQAIAIMKRTYVQFK
ncbi:MAG: S-layer homology domain-containing protein [Clostridia bacterium]|nr:S-layer homology domain-containing protein [Clostridia bacterium]